MQKPIIALTTLYDTKANSMWMLPGYADGIIQAGGIPVIVPLITETDDIYRLADMFDGFLFTGGQDVDPQLYGEETLSYCDEVCQRRDELEKSLLAAVLQKDKPILGICRGIQFINAALGGTLYQDISQQVNRDMPIQHSQKSRADIPVHSVTVKRESMLYQIVGTEKLMVNSLHHQGVKDLSDRLCASAVSPDLIIEAAEMPDKKFVLAVQWHPELMWHQDQAAFSIFEEFVRAASY